MVRQRREQADRIEAVANGYGGLLTEKSLANLQQLLRTLRSE
jgi:hypothetical protein